MNEDYLMISFENTHSAIQTERLLEQHFKVATMAHPAHRDSKLWDLLAAGGRGL